MNNYRCVVLVCFLGIPGCLDFEDRGVSPEYAEFHQNQDNEEDVRGSEGTNQRVLGPCEEMYLDAVQSFLDEKCLMCHGNPPAGAPNSLDSFDRLMEVSVSGQPQYLRVHARVSTDTMPPPSFELATPQEKEVLEAWVEVCDEELRLNSNLVDSDSPPEDASSSTNQDGSDTEQSDISSTGGDIVESDVSGVTDTQQEDECIPSADGPDWKHDIKPLFETKCFNCHGDPPTSAPFSLVNYTDVIKPSASGVPIFERSLARMEADTMPPWGGNTEDEKKLVADWISNCAIEDKEALDIVEEEESPTNDGNEDFPLWSELLPLLETDCGDCHFGGYAPFFNYEYATGGVGSSGDPTCFDLTNAACMIKFIEEGTMPPPESSQKVQNLTLETLKKWVEGGYQL